MGNCLKKPNVEEIATNAIHFVVPIRRGLCISVYDGDTITIATNLNIDGVKTLYKFNVRIRGIDCPEIKSTNENEKKYAIMAKELMYNLCYGKHVELTNVNYDKYGRILADVHVFNINVAKYMLDNKLAIQYNGKTKNDVYWKKYTHS